MALENPRYAQNPVKIFSVSLVGILVSLCVLMVGSAVINLKIGGLAAFMMISCFFVVENSLSRGFIIHRLYTLGFLKIPGLPDGKVKRYRE